MRCGRNCGHTKKWVLSLLSYRIFHNWPSSLFLSLAFSFRWTPANSVTVLCTWRQLLSSTLVLRIFDSLLFSDHHILAFLYISKKVGRRFRYNFLSNFRSWLCPRVFHCALRGVESPFLCSFLSSRRSSYWVHQLPPPYPCLREFFALSRKRRQLFFFFFFFFHFRFRFVADVRRPSASILIRRTNFTRIDPLTQSRDKRYMQGSFNWLNPHFRRALNNIFCSVCVPVHNQVRMSCCENSLVALTWYGFANATTTGP